MIPKLTGNLFRAGRALAGLTRDDLASRSGLSRDVLRSWEISSESLVPAQYQMLCRAIEAARGRRDPLQQRPVAAFPESYIESVYEQHCLGTPNSGRSYARRAHASRSCPGSWMSPSVGTILGEQEHQP